MNQKINDKQTFWHKFVISSAPIAASLGLSLMSTFITCTKLPKGFSVFLTPTYRDVPKKNNSHYRRSLPVAFPSQNGKPKSDEQSKSLLIESGSIEPKVPPQPILRLPDR